MSHLGPMTAYAVAFTLAACCTALLVPFVRALALRIGAVSHPGGRNVNARVIPRLGGVAIAIGCVVPLLLLFPATSSVAGHLRTEQTKFGGLLGGALLLATVGAIDDARRVRAIYKLYAQVIAATLAFACGFRIDAVSLPFLGVLPMGAFALPVSVLWIVGIVNALNLIDGLDGLAAGIAFFAATTNFVVAYVSGETFVAAHMATLMGALLGFLFFNFNPARIFMGDSGSYFLGFLLGTTALAGSAQKASTAISLLVPILALGVPIFDTLFTMLRRFLERRPLFSPDRGHLHHRLLDLGLTHRRAVLLLYGVSLLFTCAAISVYLGRSWEVGLALLISSAVVVALVRFAGYFEYIVLRRHRQVRRRSDDTERLRRALPGVLAGLVEAHSEADVFALLESLIPLAGLALIEIVRASDGAKLSRFAAGSTATDPACLVSARYPLGDDSTAEAHLHVSWSTPSGEVDPQTDVLLQLVADLTSGALARVASGYAPRAISAVVSVAALKSSVPARMEQSSS